MADHINISHPSGRERYADSMIRIAKLEAELKAKDELWKDAQRDLDSIFNRIAAGEQVELHYPDGSVLIAVKGRRTSAA